ncbi:MAG: two-component system, NarL family, sensor histidine kinase UhpB [Pseudonocardiales bacterium]|nr:two-component system, NarL family, sensor histidine kinase UhpB [Pseudonocardiales bacterium]
MTTAADGAVDTRSMTSDAELRPTADPSQHDDQSRRDPADRNQVGWVTVVSPNAAPSSTEGPLSLRRLLVQMTLAASVLALLVAFGGAAVSRRIAESQAVHEVAQTTDILAESVLQPSLTDAMATDLTAAKALDPLVRGRMLSQSVVRVKLWSPEGRILYSDEPKLVGQIFGLDSGAQRALSAPQTLAEITDLSLPENRFETPQRKLLEVYRPVWTPNGREMLFETYFRYDVVTDRSSQLWRGFAGITLTSVALIFLLLLPIMWALLRRARRAQNQREAMIQRALHASQDERQRIAAALHDGIVQELAAASFTVAGGAEAAAARNQHELAEQLRSAANTVRTSMGGLRSLVVDIYPPSLHSAGLTAALRDTAATIAGRAASVRFELDESAAERLNPEQQQALFRIAQESLRNTVKHAQATEAVITLSTDADGVTLEVADNGRGFDSSIKRDQHLGLSLMTDVATSVGAQLDLRTEPGHGTAWRMRVIPA